MEDKKTTCPVFTGSCAILLCIVSPIEIGSASETDLDVLRTEPDLKKDVGW